MTKNAWAKYIDNKNKLAAEVLDMLDNNLSEHEEKEYLLRKLQIILRLRESENFRNKDGLTYNQMMNK